MTRKGQQRPDQNKAHDKDDHLVQGEARAIRAEESVGGWRGDVGWQPGQESQAACQQIRSLAPTGAWRFGLSKA